MVVGVLVLAVLGLAGRAWYVHDATWVWRLVPSAASPKVQFHGRNYMGGALLIEHPLSLTSVGQTMGGGTILTTGGQTPTVIYVRDGENDFGYGLSGGP